jgi:hypothetical protein
MIGSSPLLWAGLGSEGMDMGVKNRAAPAAPGENNGASGIGCDFLIQSKPTAQPPIRRTTKHSNSRQQKVNSRTAKCKELKGLRVKN